MKNLLLIFVLVFSLLANPIDFFGQCGVKCGVERWKVKNLTDTTVKLIKFTPVKKTIDWLRSRDEPVESDKEDETRLIGIETMTFKVRGIIIGHVREDDKDFHVVIAMPNDKAKTMIIEFPSSECKEVCSSKFVSKINKARADYVTKVGKPTTKYKELDKRILVEVIGVGFWDKKHSKPQHGVAPNNIELHPVISFRVIKE